MENSMLFAYVRVSSNKGQNLDRQIQTITEYASTHHLNISRIFEEKQSGKDFDREIYQSLKNTLRRGDTLILAELDRLGRNMEQIKTEWRELEQRGIDIIVIENELLNTAGKTDLERTLICNIIFELLTYLAQKEREKLLSRQAEGIAIAKANGKYKGRKATPVDHIDFMRIYIQWKAKDITAREAMQILKINKNRFYKMVQEHETKKQGNS